MLYKLGATRIKQKSEFSVCNPKTFERSLSKKRASTHTGCARSTRSTQLLNKCKHVSDVSLESVHENIWKVTSQNYTLCISH